MSKNFITELNAFFNELIKDDVSIDRSSLVFLILSFMAKFSSFGTVRGETSTYFLQLEIFVSNMHLLYLTQKNFIHFIRANGWVTKDVLGAFFLLAEIRQMFESSKLESRTFCWFDQNASGPSFMAILANSEKLGELCNITTAPLVEGSFKTLQRFCVYTAFLEHCNRVISDPKIGPFCNFNFDRK
jgi:hypothetical protein